MSNEFYSGLNDLSEEIEDYLKNVENVQDVLEVGAKEFVSDLLKLPKPKSQIRKSGYTHLIDTFTYRKAKNNEVEVGWGKYYGRMVEYGTSKFGSRPHLRPLWERNKNKYYEKMIKKLIY